MPLFNVTHPSYRPNIVKEQVVEQTTPQPNTPRRPTVRKDFGQDVSSSAVVAEKPARLSTYDLVGYFATVRAALVVNTLAAGAFEAGGLPRYLAAQLPTAEDPSPTTEDASEAYANLKTMSYLPAQTEPSEETFTSLYDSTKREAAMTSQAETLNQSGLAIPQTQDNVNANSRPLIPYTASVPPWGGALCNQSQFGVSIRTATGTQVLQPTNVPGFVAV